MKPIKFDLPLNGAKIRNLEELRDNFTTEILELHASGVLLKWLSSRNLMTEADKLSAIPADHNDVDKLAVLCEIFGVEADRQVIEAALSKDQPSQGVALREDPEELKYKEKYEKLSELLDGLKSKKLYLTQDDYNLFVKDKIQIEQDGEVVGVVFCDETFCPVTYMRYGEACRDSIGNISGHYRIDPIKQSGDVIEVGDTICNFVDPEKGLRGSVKSSVRGVFVEMVEPSGGWSMYNHRGDIVCYIRVDHDTVPAIKIISN